MIKNLIKLADKLEEQGNKDLANRIDKILVSIAQSIEGKISAKDLVKIQPDDKRKHQLLRALIDLVDFNLVVEIDKEGKGNFVRAVPNISSGKTDGLNLGDTTSMPGINQFLGTEKKSPTFQEKLKDPRYHYIDEALQSIVPKESPTPGNVEEITQEDLIPEEELSQHSSSLVESLVKMADKFDQDGNYEMAEKIDNMLNKMIDKKAIRPKSPLKNLKDDVKNNLVLFIVDADKNLSKGVGGLKELFRRLRYFGIEDSVRDLGLDKIVKELEKSQSCLDNATKDFYAITFGKRPAESDLKDLLNNLSKENDENDDGQVALDFFDSQSGVKEEVVCDDEVSDSSTDDDDDEKLLKEFWEQMSQEAE